MIGAAAGATVGGAVGASQDNKEYHQAVRADAQRQILGLEDVVKLTRSGTSDQIIINQINTSGTIYHLTGAQIQWLHDNGVRDAVIETMQATATRPPVYIQEQPGVVYVEPPPPVGFGFVYSRPTLRRYRMSKATGERNRSPVCVCIAPSYRAGYCL